MFLWTVQKKAKLKTVARVGAILACLMVPGIMSQASADKDHDHGSGGDEMLQSLEGASEDNGKSIYYKGVTVSGKRIPIESGPHWLYMHGGGCANCHGADGLGGYVPHMCTVQTPPITLEALLSDEHDHDGDEEEHTPYTLQTIRRAIETSVNPAGKQLNPCMPKWHLTDGEYRDLLQYLKTLSK